MPEPRMPTSELTEKELELLQLVADGTPRKQIVTLLGYKSLGALNNRIALIFCKLGAADMPHAMAIAMRKGLIR